MAAAPAAPVLLIAQEPGDWPRLLEQGPFAVTTRAPSAAGAVEAAGFDLVVVDAAGWEREAAAACRRLCHGRPGVRPPVLLVGGLEPAADASVVRPFTERDLLERARLLLRLRQLERRLADRTAEVHALNDRLCQEYRRTEEAVRVSRRLQQELQPQALPATERVQFAMRQRTAGRPGGDCAGAVRLSDGRFAVYLADVLGHGTTAGLTAVYLRAALAAADGAAPDVLLSELNRVLLELGGTDPPLVALAYAVLEPASGTLSWARAGLPPPLYLPAGGPGQFWTAPGALLGVGSAAFPRQTAQLAAGDRLLFSSDGLNLGSPPTADRLLVSALEHRAEPLAEWLEHISADLRAESNPEDDWTLLALTLRPGY